MGVNNIELEIYRGCQLILTKSYSQISHLYLEVLPI